MPEQVSQKKEQKNTEPMLQVHHQELETNHAFGGLFQARHNTCQTIYTELFTLPIARRLPSPNLPSTALRSLESCRSRRF